MTPERIEELRSLLRNGSSDEKLAAMEEAALAYGEAASLVPDMATLLTSTDYVPCYHREYEFSGHAPLASTAASCIESVGVAPDVETLRRLLADHQLIELPEATYDQGAYIGDYGTDTVVPAGLAAKLVQLMGVDGFVLLDEIAANARLEEKLIAHPAQRVLFAFSKLGSTAPVGHVNRLWRELDAIQALPEVAAPATWRGFDLRDMARDCIRNLERAGRSRP